MSTMEIDDYLSSDDEDFGVDSATKKTHVIAEEDEKESVRGDNDDIDDGEEVDRAKVDQAKVHEDDLKEFSTWKMITLGVVLAYVAVNFKDWVQYFY